LVLHRTSAGKRNGSQLGIVFPRRSIAGKLATACALTLSKNLKDVGKKQRARHKTRFVTTVTLLHSLLPNFEKFAQAF